MKYETFEMTMSDGNKNFIYEWSADENVEFVVVLSHGMAEHGLRYEEFANMLCENNGALIVEDHRGHGKTAAINGMPLGWLAEKDGFKRVADDIHEEILYARKKYEGAKVVLCSHSFGSFIGQYVIENYGKDVDKAIIMGSAGPRKMTVAFAKVLGGIVKFFCGSKHYSKLIHNATFGAYNKKIKSPRTGNDWLSSDPMQVDIYQMDKLCGFVCTCGFMSDLFWGLSVIHKDKNMKKVPKDLPVMIVAGKDDPVGDYGKTVTKLADIYKANGVKKLNFKLYDGARHELLNEKCKYEVIDDIMKFIKE